MSSRTSRSPAHQWRGVIAEYRPLLDLIPADLEPVTLREGGTPLVHAGWLSEVADADVWLKVEGDNPTGSFKDRGMTTAISVALPRGRPGRRLRLDRQHLRVDVGVRRAGRHHPDRADARGQDRGRARWRRRSSTGR